MSVETLIDHMSVGGFEVVAARPAGDVPEDETSLVLVNGLAAGPKHWGPILEMLGERRPVYAVEAVSAGDDGQMTTCADNVVRIADALGLDEFYLGGQSWGSVAAQRTAIRHSSRVSKLFLAATAPAVPIVPPSLQALRAIGTPERKMEHAGDIFGGDVKRIMQSELKDLSPEELDTRLLIESLMGREIDPDKVKLQQRSILNNSLSGVYNLIGLVGLVDTPTLIVAGNKDPLTRPLNARLMQAIMPQAQLHIERGVGHDVIVTRASSVAERAHRFFDAEPRPADLATAAIGLWMRSVSNMAAATMQMFPGF